MNYKKLTLLFSMLVLLCMESFTEVETSEDFSAHPFRLKQSSSPLVEDLLKKMSIEEKVGQMTQVAINLILKDNSTTEIDQEKLRDIIVNHHIGSILNVKDHAYSAETWKKIINSIQDLAIKEKKIPVLYGIDAIHGATYLKGAILF
jgi:beta-glucosidase